MSDNTVPIPTTRSAVLRAALADPVRMAEIDANFQKHAGLAPGEAAEFYRWLIKQDEAKAAAVEAARGK